MPDDSAPLPAMVCHYAAYLQTWVQATPEASVNGNRAELRLTFGKKTFVVVFGCRKKNWSLRSLEIRRGRQVTTFDAGELVKAMAALLGNEPTAPAPQAAQGTCGPRTDTTLRERRTTVIRV